MPHQPVPKSVRRSWAALGRGRIMVPLVIVAVALFAAWILLEQLLLSFYHGEVSRVRADLRSLATGLESYRVDQGACPPMTPISAHTSDTQWLRKANGLRQTTISPALTTPVGYRTSLFHDPYSARGVPFAYHTDGSNWLLISPDPDSIYDFDSTAFDFQSTQSYDAIVRWSYDASNGVSSIGDIFREDRQMLPPDRIDH
jgi:hypothetical protein